MTETDVIAAVATARGPGAIVIVRLSGPDLSRFVFPLCGRPLHARQAVLTDFLDADGKPLDTGIALFFQSPESYTGEDVLELHGHGGTARERHQGRLRQVRCLLDAVRVRGRRGVRVS